MYLTVFKQVSFLGIELALKSSVQVIKEIFAMTGLPQLRTKKLPSLRVIANKAKNDLERETLIQAIQNLSMELQQTLVIEQLLDIFCEQVIHIVPCNSVHYEHQEKQLQWETGTSQVHSCVYQLNLEGVSFGNIRCTREYPFSANDLQIIEWLVAILIYPIRNAMLYNEALSISRHDALTGVDNRMSYDEAITREIAKARRHETELSLLIVDIDLFKNFNDKYGHITGDKVLKAVANQLKNTLRTSDLLYRYGGEEFAVILSDTHSGTAFEVAERLRFAVSELDLENIDETVNITISIGTSTYQKGDTSLSLFKKADDALYRAKSNGRNKVETAA